MKLRRIVLLCLILVLIGAGILYTRPVKTGQETETPEEEIIKPQADSSESEKSNQDVLSLENSQSDAGQLPSDMMEAGGGIVTPEAGNLNMGSSLVKKGMENLGTAQHIGGKTIIVSVFINNDRYRWDFNDPEDFQSYSNLYSQLQTASEWLEAQTKAWDVYSDIEWDWHNNEDLFYVANINSPMKGDGISQYYEVTDWLETHVDVDALVTKFNADNVIFMYYLNSDLYEEQHCFSFQFDFSYLSDQQIGYEGVLFNLHHGGYTLGAPTMAHEILHCFGAVDLYYSSDMISDEYVNYLTNIGSEDIMYMIYDDPDRINEKFSELDAYYTGLTSYAADASRFGLGLSAHQR